MGQSFHPEEMLNREVGRSVVCGYVCVCARPVGEGSGSGHVSGLSLSTLAAVRQDLSLKGKFSLSARLTGLRIYLMPGLQTHNHIELSFYKGAGALN